MYLVIRGDRARRCALTQGGHSAEGAGVALVSRREEHHIHTGR